MTAQEYIDGLINLKDKAELEQKLVIVVNDLANEGFELADIKRYIIELINRNFYVNK
jgi:hypothetical protein